MKKLIIASQICLIPLTLLGLVIPILMIPRDKNDINIILRDQFCKRGIKNGAGFVHTFLVFFIAVAQNVHGVMVRIGDMVELQFIIHG